MYKIYLWLLLISCLGSGAAYSQTAENQEAQADAVTSAPAASPVAQAEALPDLPKSPEKAGPRVADVKYWAVTSALFAASVADAEALHACANCSIVPDQMHRRGLTYGAGLPLSIIGSYAGYKLKQKGQKWWFVPQVVLAAANGYLSYHWATSAD